MRGLSLRSDLFGIPSAFLRVERVDRIVDLGIVDLRASAFLEMIVVESSDSVGANSGGNLHQID